MGLLLITYILVAFWCHYALKAGALSFGDAWVKRAIKINYNVTTQHAKKTTVKNKTLSCIIL